MEWQEWHIALSDLQAVGVDTAAVKKMYVGLGDRDDRAAPQRSSQKHQRRRSQVKRLWSTKRDDVMILCGRCDRH